MYKRETAAAWTLALPTSSNRVTSSTAARSHEPAISNLHQFVSISVTAINRVPSPGRLHVFASEDSLGMIAWKTGLNACHLQSEWQSVSIYRPFRVWRDYERGFRHEIAPRATNRLAYLVDKSNPRHFKHPNDIESTRIKETRAGYCRIDIEFDFSVSELKTRVSFVPLMMLGKRS